MIFLLRLRLAYGRSRSRDEHMLTGQRGRPKGTPPGSRDVTALVVPAQTGHRNGWRREMPTALACPACHTGLLARRGDPFVPDLHEGSAGDGIPTAVAV